MERVLVLVAGRVELAQLLLHFDSEVLGPKRAEMSLTRKVPSRRQLFPQLWFLLLEVVYITLPFQALDA
jgi:hypothetical protein